MNELVIDGVIGMEVFAIDVRTQLADMKAGPLTVYLNTIGGSVFEGISIYNQLRRRGDVEVVVDGAALSIGTVIAMAGDRIYMAAGTQWMIHNPWSVSIGDDEMHIAAAEPVRRAKDDIRRLYVEHTGQPEDTIRDWMQATTYFTADEAAKAGFVDDVAASVAAKEFSVPPGLYPNTPTTIVDPTAKSMHEMLLASAVCDWVGEPVALDREPEGDDRMKTRKARALVLMAEIERRRP